MIILAVDTTGETMSAALSDGSRIIDEIYGNSEKRHLETLMPCINEIYGRNSLDISGTDLFAVSIGPGSFTGIRIGAAAVSALAQAEGKPVAQVDTLAALCRNAASDGYVCAMIDAGRQEVFARIEKAGKEIMPSQPVGIRDLVASFPKESITVVGDGAEAYRDIISECASAVFAHPKDMHQKASSVCLVALEMKNAGRLSSCFEINPEYLRLSQAERLKNAK